MNIIIAKSIALIFLVESNRGADTRPGDNGDAVGPLGIHLEVVLDCNTFAGYEKYKPEDREDFEKSRQMCIDYLRHWGSYNRLGRPATIQDLCRIWNGGPNGCYKLSTLPYWDRVKERYYSLSNADALRKFVKI